MALGLFVAQFQGFGPAFQSGIIRLDQVGIRALQALEQFMALDRDGSLAAQRLKKVNPLA